MSQLGFIIHKYLEKQKNLPNHPTGCFIGDHLSIILWLEKVTPPSEDVAATDRAANRWPDPISPRKAKPNTDFAHEESYTTRD